MARNIDIYQKYALNYEWWDSSFDSFKEIGAAIGFDIDNIYFSGFASQGDGACFTGSISYRKGWKAALAQVTSDPELLAIGQTWQELQARCFYQLHATVSHSGRYSHEYTATLDCEDARDSYRDLPDGTCDAATEIARDFMRYIYRSLETEHDYQQAWQWANAWQDLGESMKETRKEARQLVKDMRDAIKGGLNATPSICGALRSQLRNLIDQWEEQRAEREQLDSDFYYYQDGKSVSIAQFAASNL